MANWLDNFNDGEETPVNYNSIPTGIIKPPKIVYTTSGSRYMPEEQTIYLNPEDNYYDPSIYQHEMFHHWQNLNDKLRKPDEYEGPLVKPSIVANEEAQMDYYNRRNVETKQEFDKLYKQFPVFRLTSPYLNYDKKVNPELYKNPKYAEGEAEEYQNYIKGGGTPAFMAKGGLIKRADGSYSRRGLWDNIRANRGSGRKPTAEMLRQERKIKKKEDGGWIDIYAEGDVVGEDPKPVTPTSTPISYNINDFYITPDEIELYKQRAEECHSKGQCLEQAFRFYDKYVAPNLGTPNSWDIKKNAGISSGATNPNFNQYGESADSWDIHGLLQEKGATKILAANVKNPMSIEQNLSKMTPSQQEDYFISLNIPLGSVIGMGSSGTNKSSTSYNSKLGLVDSNHSASVIGYNERGVPMIFDYGEIKPITSRTFTSDAFPITNITAPKETAQYTYEYLKANNKLQNDYTPLNLKTNTTEYDEDEYIPFIDALKNNKAQYANAFGLTNTEYDELAKKAAALALTETGGGDDATIRWKGIIPIPSYLTDKLGIGDTTGITQINSDMIFNSKELSKKLEAVGITKDNYDPWNSNHIAAATIALLKSNVRPAERAYNINTQKLGYDPGLSDAAITYYQWNQPSLLIKGEAKGESEKVKKFQNNYNLIDIGDYLQLNPEGTPNINLPEVKVEYKKGDGSWVTNSSIPTPTTPSFYDAYSDRTLTNYQMGTDKAPMYKGGGFLGLGNKNPYRQYYDMSTPKSLGESPSWRAYTYAKSGFYSPVTQDPLETLNGSPLLKRVKYDDVTGFNYMVDKEGQPYGPIEMEGDDAFNLTRFIINPYRGKFQTYDLGYKKDGTHQTPFPQTNNPEEQKANIFKDLYGQNLIKYGDNRRKAFRKTSKFMDKRVDPLFEGAWYDYNAFNLNNGKTEARIPGVNLDDIAAVNPYFTNMSVNPESGRKYFEQKYAQEYIENLGNQYGMDAVSAAHSSGIPVGYRKELNSNFNKFADKRLTPIDENAVVDEMGTPRYNYYNGDKLITQDEFNKAASAYSDAAPSQAVLVNPNFQKDLDKVAPAYIDYLRKYKGYSRRQARKEVDAKLYKKEDGGPVMYGPGGGVQPFITSDINEYNRRKQAYADSLYTYNYGQANWQNAQLKLKQNVDKFNAQLPSTFGHIIGPSIQLNTPQITKGNYWSNAPIRGIWPTKRAHQDTVDANTVSLVRSNYLNSFHNPSYYQPLTGDALQLYNQGNHQFYFPYRVADKYLAGADLWDAPKQQVIFDKNAPKNKITKTIKSLPTPVKNNTEIKKEEIEPITRKFDFSINEDLKPIAPTPYVPDPVRKVMNPAFDFNIDFEPNRTKEAVVDQAGNPRYKYYNGDKIITEQEYNKLIEKKANGGLVMYNAGSTVWTKQDTPLWAAGTPTPTATQNFRNDRSLNTDLYRIGDVIPTGMNYKTPAAGTYDYSKDIQPYHTMRLHAPDTTMMAKHGSYVKKHINSPRIYGNPVNPSSMSEGPTSQRGGMVFGDGSTVGGGETLPIDPRTGLPVKTLKGVTIEAKKSFPGQQWAYMTDDYDKRVAELKEDPSKWNINDWKNYGIKEGDASAEGFSNPLNWPGLALAGLGAWEVGAPVLGAVNSALSVSLPSLFGSSAMPYLTGNTLLGAYGASQIPGNLRRGEYGWAALNSLPVTAPLLGAGFRGAKNLYNTVAGESGLFSKFKVNPPIQAAEYTVPEPVEFYPNGFNLKKSFKKVRPPKPSVDAEPLTGSLVLEKNPSRVENIDEYLGTKRDLKRVVDPKTNESISLKSWRDENGNIRYYFSSQMPYSSYNAGKSYYALDKFIPKNSIIVEPPGGSLSFDSFINTVKRTKNPKFKSSLLEGSEGIRLNNQSVKNKLPFSGDIGDGYYSSLDEAQKVADEINGFIKDYNLPKATVTQHPYDGSYQIMLPHISLEKVYKNGSYVKNNNSNTWLDSYN